MNGIKIRNLLGVLGIALLICGLVMIGIGFKSYDPTWRLYYGKAHLRNAVSVTEIPSTLHELMRAKDILKTIPREGNTDPFARNPRNDLATAWQTLDEMLEYARANQNRTGSEKQLVIYNLQEKSHYFFDANKGRWEAFEDYNVWVAGQAWGSTGFIVAIVGAFFLFAFSTISMVIGIVIIVALVVFAILINTFPFWYWGPQ